MATTRLSDVIVPEVYFDYMSKDTTEKTTLFTSGIMRPDASLAAKLAGGGTTFNVPFWKDLDSTEADIATDDPAVLSTPGKITTGKDIAVRQFRTRSWSTMDLTAELAGSDPMQRILARTTNYWDRQFQSYLVASLYGITLSNVANNSGDMVYDVATDASGAPAAGELISPEAIGEGAFTMGDGFEGVRTLMMHSTVLQRLDELDLIDYVQPSGVAIGFPTYRGKRVIVNDNVKTVAGSNRVKYHTYLFGDGVFGWAESPPAMPVEVDRVPAAGGGSGQEILYTRRQFVMHPYGIKWTSSSMSGEFPTSAELATSANWSRVYAERKQIPLAVIITNG